MHEILFDQGIGDLFVIRNTRNLVSDIDTGSFEYAVENLNVKVIIILRYTDCNAIKAYIDNIVETITEEKSNGKPKNKRQNKTMY